ncbi:hypothetical protein ADUPG1_006488 [Aduncisulcus paluster]|uniref:Uncharacterized protein n=1 Tax=Aduncisulcus paluster TaxID=2918883 RepID=A0ABQ5KIF2_9EUKA|nr:hypothetical protein ADUPG1_006488 [Aduncisulcus paluster]
MVTIISDVISLTKDETDLFSFLIQVLRHYKLTTVLRVAGGWVRDKIMKKPSKDIDIAIDNMMGQEFAEYCNRYMSEVQHLEPSKIGVIAANPDQSKHLETACIVIHGKELDLVNLRCETYAKDSRIPTISIGTPSEDAFRRDLTINALFYNINDNTIEDYCDCGLADIRDKIIRTPLDPRETFLDDPLRVLRAIRFTTRFGFKMDLDLVSAIKSKEVKHRLTTLISRERVYKELTGALLGPNPIRTVELILDLDLFDTVFLQGIPEPIFEKQEDKLEFDSHREADYEKLLVEFERMRKESKRKRKKNEKPPPRPSYIDYSFSKYKYRHEISKIGFESFQYIIKILYICQIIADCDPHQLEEVLESNHISFSLLNDCFGPGNPIDNVNLVFNLIRYVKLLSFSKDEEKEGDDEEESREKGDKELRDKKLDESPSPIVSRSSLSPLNFSDPLFLSIIFSSLVSGISQCQCVFSKNSREKREPASYVVIRQGLKAPNYVCHHTQNIIESGMIILDHCQKHNSTEDGESFFEKFISIIRSCEDEKEFLAVFLVAQALWIARTHDDAKDAIDKDVDEKHEGTFSPMNLFYKYMFLVLPLYPASSPGRQWPSLEHLSIIRSMKPLLPLKDVAIKIGIDVSNKKSLKLLSPIGRVLIIEQCKILSKSLSKGECTISQMTEWIDKDVNKDNIRQIILHDHPESTDFFKI